MLFWSLLSLGYFESPEYTSSALQLFDVFVLGFFPGMVGSQPSCFVWVLGGSSLHEVYVSTYSTSVVNVRD